MFQGLVKSPVKSRREHHFEFFPLMSIQRRRMNRACVEFSRMLRKSAMLMRVS